MWKVTTVDGPEVYLTSREKAVHHMNTQLMLTLRFLRNPESYIEDYLLKAISKLQDFSNSNSKSFVHKPFTISKVKLEDIA
jgi:hypothetical protein